MTRKIRAARELITREEFEAARVDILTYTLRRLLAQVPEAQIIEMTAYEHYDDGEPGEEQLALFDWEGNPCP